MHRGARSFRFQPVPVPINTPHDQATTTRNKPATTPNKDGQNPSQRVDAMGQTKKRVVVLNFWKRYSGQTNGPGRGFARTTENADFFSRRDDCSARQLQIGLGTEDFVQGDKVKVAQ